MFILKDIRGLCDPERTEQPLHILLSTVLAKSFSAHVAHQDIAEVLIEYLDELDRETDLFSAWQRPAFYEWIIPRWQEHQSGCGPCETAHDLFATLFRSNKRVPHAAVDIRNFTPMSGEKLHLPPVRIPLIPLSYRYSRGQKTADEVTVVSWIPDLAQAVKQPHWSVLNRFFGARKIHCVWCDPEKIRTFLTRNADRIMITSRLPESEVALHKDYVNGIGKPWVDLVDFALPEELLRRHTATMFKAIPVYWSEWMATLAVVDGLSADDHNYLSQLYNIASPSLK
jgi:hypothetical protein